MVGMDAPRPPLSVGGFMAQIGDFCDWVAFVCWADFDGVFSPNIDGQILLHMT